MKAIVTFAQLSNMDFSKLSTAAEAAGGLSSNLATRGEEVRTVADIPGAIWTGADSQDGNVLQWLNGDFIDDPILNLGMETDQEGPFQKATKEEWERSFMGISLSSQHSHGDRVNFSLPWDGKVWHQRGSQARIAT